MSDSDVRDASEQQLAYAKRAIEEPFYTSYQERLKAVEYLALNPDPSAIDVLTQAFEAAYLSAEGNAQLERDSLGVRGGDLSALAARSLAKNPSPKGLPILVSVLSDPKKNALLRESAAYGLGTICRPEAYEAFTVALYDTDPHLLSVVINAIEETLSISTEIQDPKFKELMETLLLFSLDGRESVSESYTPIRDRALTLVSKYWNQPVEKLSKEILLHAKDPKMTEWAFDLLHYHSKDSALETCIECLKKRDRSGALYRKIGESFSQAGNKELKRTAKRVLRESVIPEKIFQIILPRRAEALAARRQAATRILG